MKTVKHKKNLQAYTLLELIFVILIISIITTAVISLYQNFSTTAKVKRTVQQMQLILQAASGYYIDNNCWPGGNDCQPNVPNFTKYLPFKANTNGSFLNPWGQPYVYNQNGKKFAVGSGTLPDDLAARVAAFLPTGIIDPNYANRAMAEIIIPAKRSTPNSNYILATMGVTPLSRDWTELVTPQFTCPDNSWQANSFFFPIVIYTDNDNRATSFQCATEGSKNFAVLGAFTNSNVNDNGCELVAGTTSTWQCKFRQSFAGWVVSGIDCQYSTADEYEPNDYQATGLAMFGYIGWCSK